MSWPNPPYPFANATSPEAMAFLDQMFDQVGAMIQIPCTASGTNAISLTPNVNCPALSAYHELGGFRFRAVATSTGAVTAQYNGLGFLPVYHIDGTTQASTGDLTIGAQFVITYSAALNGGLGGFFLESPSVPNQGATAWHQPGGRLTLVNSSPVVFSNQSNIQNIFYVPYQHPFVPIYNGSNVQLYNFTPSLGSTTGLTLALGGAANFPNGAVFDVFATLISGNPALVAVQWTNTSTRATTLSVFGGFLTNSGSATAQTGANTSTTLAINQGTFLGSFFTTAQGASSWVFGGSASGGSAANLYVSNYYNAVLFNTATTDSGASYTYNSSTVREARASTGNQINFLQTSSERAIVAAYNSNVNPSAAGITGEMGIGINSTTTFSALSEIVNGGSSILANMTTGYIFSITGTVTIAALEASAAGSSTFNSNSANQLEAALWL